MKIEKVFWTDYSVLICTKCQKTIIPAHLPTVDEHNIAEAIKNKFKTELNTIGLKDRVRVMTSSCLSVCPGTEQALSVVSTTDPSKSLSYVFNPYEETEIVLELVKKLVLS